MKGIFLDCKSLNHLDITKLTIFYYNRKYLYIHILLDIKVDLSNFKTNNVSDMRIMFHGCSSLKELNVSNFVTDNVQFMSYMFSECNLLK